MLNYLIKLSISLAVLYVFYRAVLRPLTFYRWNRFYLLGYAVLSFLIPLLNIDDLLNSKSSDYGNYIAYIPSVDHMGGLQSLASTPWWKTLTAAQWLLILFSAGVTVMLIRFLLQLMALRRFRQKSRLLSNENGVALYETAAKAVPFSFGRSIFINPASHSQDELERIIQHEFVHVRQNHTIDLLLAELLCIVNWFNPFAWLIRHAIRQNLEFLADDQVLKNGLEKRDYQYLLLKVTGNDGFAIAGHFNFSSLKKRIVMMNKIKSARVHAARFLFVLPLLAVSLLAFRSYHDDAKTVWLAGMVIDAQTHLPLPDATVSLSGTSVAVHPDKNGYYELEIPYENKPLSFQLDISHSGYQPIHQTENWGNFYETPVASRYKYSYEFFGMSTSGGGFSALSKSVNSRQQLNAQRALDLLDDLLKKQQQQGAFVSMATDTVPAKPGVRDDEINIDRQRHKDASTGAYNDKVIVTHGDGRVEEYDFAKPAERAAFKKKYGKLEVPPPTPAPGADKKAAIPPPPPPLPARSGKKQPTAPIPPVVSVHAAEAPAVPPVYYIDGKEAAPEAVKKVLADSIASVNVWKGEAAKERYGDKGVNGVVEIHTKSVKSKPLPPGVLLFVDGIEMPEGTNADEMLKPTDIKEIHVLKGEEAIKKYGDRAKKGVVEITTKAGVDTKKVSMSSGDVKVQLKRSSFAGQGAAFSLEMTKPLPLIVYDGRKFPNMKSFCKPSGHIGMSVLSRTDGIAKYGTDAANGVLEINSL